MQAASPGDAKSGSDALRRYGPLAGIAVLLIVVVAAVLVGGGKDDQAGDDEPPAECPRPDIGYDAETPGAPEPVCGMPVTYAEAEAAGTVADHTWPDTCDTETGQLTMPTVYAPPCVPEFTGANGGATYRGVTADKITIVRYVPDPAGDLSSLLAGMGVDETPEDQRETFDDYMTMWSSMIETYGREIEVIDYQGTGASDDEIASRADAQQIIEQHQPFAVMGGPTLDRGAFAQELAEAEVLCLDCGLAVPSKLIQEAAPLMWGGGPSIDQLLATLAAWVSGGFDAAEAAGETEAASFAVFAGDESMHTRERKVGVIHFEQDPPIFDETAEEQQSQFDATYALRESYLFSINDLASLQQKAVELIAKMKDEEITTILFLGDPVMPIFLTNAATEQEFFPEWIFTGTVLTDSTVFGRQYNQEQMANTFGLSNLPAPTIRDLQDPWRLYKWYHGPDAVPPARAQYGVIYPGPARVALAIHMAGPTLTPETFGRGLFRVPPMGGGPTRVQVSYGNWGYHEGLDIWGTDDSVEIWWDPAAEGTDETGCDGVGMWRYSNEATRFTRVDAPVPAPFSVENTVTQFSELPPEDATPDYPPPPGSPAAEGTGRVDDDALRECPT